MGGSIQNPADKLVGTVLGGSQHYYNETEWKFDLRMHMFFTDLTSLYTRRRERKRLHERVRDPGRELVCEP